MISRATILWSRFKGKNPELLPLLCAFVLAAGTLGFAKFASEVREGETQSFDEAVLRGLRKSDNPAEAMGPRWFQQAMRDLTSLGSVVVLSLVAAMATGFLLLQRRKIEMALLLSGLGGGLLVTGALKHFFHRSRPTVVPHLDFVTSASFPSGHAMLATIVYTTLAAILANTTQGWKTRLYIVSLGLFLTLVVGLTRIYLGVHYPTDVLAGWTVGILWSILCWLVARRFLRRPKGELTRACAAGRSSGD